MLMRFVGVKQRFPDYRRRVSANVFFLLIKNLPCHRETNRPTVARAKKRSLIVLSYDPRSNGVR